MANEITSMIMAQAPRAASESGQTVKVNSAELPGQGNALPPQQAVAQSASKSEIREAVSQVNNFVQSVQRDLSFSMDEGSGKTIIKVIDSDSGKLVRQIPSEEVLALTSLLKESGSGSTDSISLPQGMLFSDIT